MEALFQSFQQIPIDAIRFQGLIQLILISGVLIFKLKISAPKKRDQI